MTKELIDDLRAEADGCRDQDGPGRVTAMLLDRAADVLSRAAVSDTATERFEKSERHRLYWRRRYQSMHKRAKAAEAERDAALAVIERCRGVLSAWESRQERNREILGSGGLGHFKAIDCTGDLRAALDGASEPEWEYSVGFNDPECGWINDNADIHDNYEDASSDYSEPKWLVEDRVVRRRKAGPWLPVEGESK